MVMKNEKYDMNNPDLKKNPFRVPEGYFDSLEDRIREKIAEEESISSEKPKKFYFHIKSAVSMAASLLLLFGLGYGIMTVVSFFGNNETGDDADRIVYIEEGFLRSSFIDFMYDDIDYNDEVKLDSETLSELNENITLLLRDLSEEDLIDYYLALSEPNKD